MKKQTLNVIALFSLSILLSVAVFSAGTRFTVKGKIPFAFSVGNQTLAAGDYTIRSANSGVGIQICSKDCRERTQVLTNDALTRQEVPVSKLVFRRYGNQYFLARVWLAEESYGYEVPPSRTERELRKNRAKHLAQNAAEPELVSINAE